jgi:signal transduction histidine kinase
LIISDDPEFAPTLVARWQNERRLPTFCVMNTPVPAGLLTGGFELAIIGGVAPSQLPAIVKVLDTFARPAIHLASASAQLNHIRAAHPRLKVLSEHEGWADTLVLLADETLRRLEAVARARRAEQALGRAESDATLGRYMLEMRHNLNNALTSILGNSELLLLEPGAFSSGVREQLATVHTMALRLHDIFQRFTLMEQEMRFTGTAQPEMPIQTPGLSAIPTQQ